MYPARVCKFYPPERITRQPLVILSFLFRSGARRWRWFYVHLQCALRPRAGGKALAADAPRIAEVGEAQDASPAAMLFAGLCASSDTGRHRGVRPGDAVAAVSRGDSKRRSGDNLCVVRGASWRAVVACAARAAMRHTRSLWKPSVVQRETQSGGGTVVVRGCGGSCGLLSVRGRRSSGLAASLFARSVLVRRVSLCLYAKRMHSAAS